MSINEIWDKIVLNSGNTVKIKGKNSFTYTVREDVIFIPQANWRITRSEISTAAAKLSNPAFAKSAENSSSYVYAIIFAALNN